jgi:pimeloyl-ACP methyl ester carboxylesterase
MCDGVPEIGIALMRDFGNYEPAPALEAVEVPVRCLNADMWSTNVEANRRYQPDFHAVVMSDVGHFLMMEKPEEFNALLRGTLTGLDLAAE